MDFEKYTDRARGFVQSAQSLALREGHQQFAAEHLLKILLDDPEGLAAGLIDRSGARSRTNDLLVESRKPHSVTTSYPIRGGRIAIVENLTGTAVALAVSIRWD
jgi:ATP-dependent Clp protease ATP-binding subunit ClpB